MSSMGRVVVLRPVAAAFPQASSPLFPLFTARSRPGFPCPFDRRLGWTVRLVPWRWRWLWWRGKRSAGVTMLRRRRDATRRHVSTRLTSRTPQVRVLSGHPAGHNIWWWWLCCKWDKLFGRDVQQAVGCWISSADLCGAVSSSQFKDDGSEGIAE